MQAVQAFFTVISAGFFRFLIFFSAILAFKAFVYLYHRVLLWYNSIIKKSKNNNKNKYE